MKNIEKTTAQNIRAETKSERRVPNVPWSPDSACVKESPLYVVNQGGTVIRTSYYGALSAYR